MRIETVGLATLDGLHLEGDVAFAEPAAGPVRGAVVLAHPHPLYGGDRTNLVVDALFRALPEAGWHALRFDFRGVGASEGSFGGGTDERLDVVAAIDALDTVCGNEPIWAGGYSFGAMVALNVTDQRLAGWVAVAPPLAALDGAACLAAADHRPTLVVVPEHDQFSPPAATEAIVAGWAATELRTVPMGDHFLAGRTAWVAEQVVAWLSSR